MDFPLIAVGLDRLGFESVVIKFRVAIRAIDFILFHCYAEHF